MRQIHDDIFLIPTPTPTNMGDLNCYLIRGREHSALVDIGCNTAEAHAALMRALDELGVSLDTLEVWATHGHSDHLGGLERLWREGMVVRSGITSFDEQRERNRRRKELLGAQLRRFRQRVPDVLPSTEAEKNEARFSPTLTCPIAHLADGDVLAIGDYRFQAIATPGHDVTEMCFWEPDAGIFIAGDHVLGQVIPSVYVEGFDLDEVGAYVASLDKVADLPARLVAPAHGEPFANLRERCQLTKSHLRQRVEDAYGLVASGTSEFMEICYAMTRLPGRKPWELRNEVGQWKVVTETAGFLANLRATGRVTMTEHDAIYRFTPRA